MNTEISEDLIERACKGRSTKEDGLLLLEIPPFKLFRFADELRSLTVGDTVTYVVNRNINFTSRCVGTCGFCAFRTNNGKVLSIEEIMEKVREAERAKATEVCIQGGLLPDVGLDFYQGIAESIKAEFPEMHIHAFSPMEVYHASRISGMKVSEALSKLKRSGLDTMPGTAAEILSDRVREIICPSKLRTEEWIKVVTQAHTAGIPTTATMMYGHVETPEERIDHILTIREIQKETGGITEFVPLPFMPYNNPVGEKMIREGRYATPGLEDLKIYAISRILLHGHVDNIQASWVKLGKKLSQFALSCGANDLGGTLMEESISRLAGAPNGESISVEELEWMIYGAGRVPKERTTLYKGVRELASRNPGRTNGCGVSE
ncbi:5-amino-6-(D-ribitylamino)uracil--L-tyrosine 4-hydroxyphenyl transferase CofH [Methanosarcina sp.]|uniref:5-amino-6-(D-ribitylamino)uracil--L-tyrosine 4-hydroxyphenyl transferase CofH n=1 Tax=Methanosarcina sp. TaxID=2213 RepID=UPI0029884E78|nr:5-amino-6-(D-ribitylamino)uracil--L-tyrosine 4-hydroxyphenyl transferase CofH [Methanosarcina sp.]MDW5551119.1 5-amino-6-(D-ribitylamino)uracil--L-tyrosine 4-hydroxyphenyl transferase CofH [Methanosarcina sp.]MDW5552850.1 5-amino-6-(D-ribitylamino)uracil--L-tyrosine 4-hydroxyphenyl transferase CofH [Methanosarcina sp.]MDW5558135.1 5-amino-6-(D-ribitylamino)uracil--L-tyrosine 4-hydroxyphenyl transferase CofH [Methanosarcina sp.]